MWKGVVLWHEWEMFIHIRRKVGYITVNLTLTKDGVIFNKDDNEND